MRTPQLQTMRRQLHCIDTHFTCERELGIDLGLVGEHAQLALNQLFFRGRLQAPCSIKARILHQEWH